MARRALEIAYWRGADDHGIHLKRTFNRQELLDVGDGLGRRRGRLGRGRFGRDHLGRGGVCGRWGGGRGKYGAKGVGFGGIDRRVKRADLGLVLIMMDDKMKGDN